MYGLPSWRSLCHAISKVEGMTKAFKDIAVKHGGIKESYFLLNIISLWTQ